MSLKSKLLKELGKGPASEKQLRARVDANGKKITKALQTLAQEKNVVLEKGVYSLPAARKSTQNTLPGRLVKLGKTFGFVQAADGSGDIFIPGHSLHGAMPGDEVDVLPEPKPRVAGSREGEIVQITKQQNNVVGTVQKQDGKLWLLPGNAPGTMLPIRKSADGGVKDGEKAAGQILERGVHHAEHQVAITVRFGSADSARQNAKAILYAAGIEKGFPDKVKAEAKKVADEKISKDDTKRRQDLRDVSIITIDSAKTKDIDDAISVSKTKSGYTLSVHIADVSQYVKAKSQLDECAYRRGTSVYYADSVVPMLPRQLSNGICSLNEGEDRLALSCVMKMDEDGKMESYRFIKTIIRSRLKGVYSEVNSIFEGTADEKTQKKYAKVQKNLLLMRQLYQKLALRRAQRGSLEIDSEEAEIEVDESGRCVGVHKRHRGESERMIEEFMLAANTAAAHYARKQELPFVYRVHDKPSQDKAEALQKVLDALGLGVHFEKTVPTQQELEKLLNQTRGTNLARPVHYAVLRSMAKASYEPKPKGHFGLALADYAHFTSPIRRYPDLVVHRILSDSLAGTSVSDLHKRYDSFVEVASRQSSERELVAATAERDCDDCYKAEYMKGDIGKTFSGIVSSVQLFGIFVELPNTVEGMLPIEKLTEGHMDLIDGVQLSDPLTGVSYRIGDEVRVRVQAVDVSKGQVEFDLAPSNP